MFNRYIAQDNEAFEDLYRPVEETVESEEPPAQEAVAPQAEIKEEKVSEEKSTSASKNNIGLIPDLKHILKGLNFGELGLLPLLLLAFLIMDVENDEKLLIVFLAIVLGI